MLKYVLLGVVLVGIWFVFFRKPSFKDELDSQMKEEKKPKKKMKNEEVMVECIECGTFVSNKEAFIRNGQFFCSQECLEHKK